MLISAGHDNAHDNQRRGPDITPEITLVLAVSGFTVFLFVAKALRVGVIAIFTCGLWLRGTDKYWH
jgi:hypothetical protein